MGFFRESYGSASSWAASALLGREIHPKEFTQRRASSKLGSIIIFSNGRRNINQELRTLYLIVPCAGVVKNINNRILERNGCSQRSIIDKCCCLAGTGARRTVGESPTSARWETRMLISMLLLLFVLPVLLFVTALAIVMVTVASRDYAVNRQAWFQEQILVGLDLLN